jgi:signal transduction histidine kinase
VDRLLQTVVDSATSCLATEFGTLMLLNRGGDGLIEKVVNGFLCDPLAKSPPEAGEQPLLLELAVKGDALLVNEDERGAILRAVQKQDDRIRSLMIAPLVLKEAVVGVIVIYFMEGAGGGTPDKLRFLSALASHAAIALENARLVARIEGFNRELEQKVRERTADLRKAYEELKELDHLKDDFLSSMSHELLTPLTSIQSFTEILTGMSETEARESSHEFLSIIHSETLRLTRRLKDLLDLSQIEAGKVEFHLQAVTMREILDGLFREMADEFRAKSLKAVIRVPPAACDRRWISRAVGALLSNAVKFSEEGSEVEIEIGREGTDVTLEVTDHGCGIATEFQADVFERFKQLGDVLTDKPAGVGLGLPLAKQIVVGHGGWVRVESAPGEGARFTLAIPAFVEDEDELAPSEPVSGAAAS